MSRFGLFLFAILVVYIRLSLVTVLLWLFWSIGY